MTNDKKLHKCFLRFQRKIPNFITNTRHTAKCLFGNNCLFLNTNCKGNLYLNGHK